MRVSIMTGDPGCGPDVSRVSEVYLDGVEQSECITADDMDGLIVRYARNGDGNLVRVPSGDQFATETLRGKVVIVLRE